MFFVGLRKDIFKDNYFNFDNLKFEEMVSTSKALSDLPQATTLKNGLEYTKPPENEYQKYMRENSGIILNHEITKHTQNHRHYFISSMVEELKIYQKNIIKFEIIIMHLNV